VRSCKRFWKVEIAEVAGSKLLKVEAVKLAAVAGGLNFVVGSYIRKDHQGRG